MIFSRLACLALTLLFASLPYRALAAESGTSQKNGDGEGTIVFLAASLQPVLLAIEKRHDHGFSLRLVPASSGLLARQIAAGAPADLYLTADRKWTAWLKAQNISLLAQKTFLSNQLALVEPLPLSLSATSAQQDAQHDEVILSASQTRAQLVAATRIAIGDPSHVPVGLYAKQVFASLSLDTPAFLSKLVPLVNTRATVLHVEREEVPLGIVYRSDALFAKRAERAKMRIVGYLPSTLHDPIAYDLLLLREKGRWLYTLLGEDSSVREEFVRFGFSPL